MGACTLYGYGYGHPKKLLSPIDGDKNICGVTNGYQDYPYLFIGDISGAIASKESVFMNGVCVKKCPATAEESKTLECKTTKEIDSCNNSELNSYGTTSYLKYCTPIYDTLSPSIRD